MSLEIVQQKVHCNSLAAFALESRMKMLILWPLIQMKSMAWVSTVNLLQRHQHLQGLFALCYFEFFSSFFFFGFFWILNIFLLVHIFTIISNTSFKIKITFTNCANTWLFYSFVSLSF